VKDVGYFDKMSAKQMHEGVDDALAADGLDCNVRPHVCGEGEKELTPEERAGIWEKVGISVVAVGILDINGLLSRAACRRKIEEGKEK
jgi:hypothetical protein